MGTHFFKAGNPGMVRPSSLNMEARAQSAPGYAGRQAMGRSQKDLAAALGAAHAGGLKPLTKTAAVDAPGPKKV